MHLSKRSWVTPFSEKAQNVKLGRLVEKEWESYLCTVNTWIYQDSAGTQMGRLDDLGY